MRVGAPVLRVVVERYERDEDGCCGRDDDGGVVIGERLWGGGGPFRERLEGWVVAECFVLVCSVSYCFGGGGVGGRGTMMQSGTTSFGHTTA